MGLYKPVSDELRCTETPAKNTGTADFADEKKTYGVVWGFGTRFRYASLLLLPAVNGEASHFEGCNWHRARLTQALTLTQNPAPFRNRIPA